MRTAFLFISVLFLSVTCQSEVIQVGKNQRIATIRQALAQCHPGDTILVLRGIYKEGNLVVTKPVTLIGKDHPVLDGQLKYEILSIGGSHITLDGFTLQNSRFSSSNDYAAISITNGSDIIIKNNKINNAHFGIHVNNSSQCRIENNDIAGKAISEQESGNGIHLWKCQGVSIINNHITGHRDGIYFEFVSHSEIRNNLSEKNIRYGLHFMFSSYDLYYNNTFSNNGTGVAVMYSNHVTMYYNTFKKNWGSASYAILLKEISDSKICYNKFLSNTIALFLEGTSRMLIQRNLFRENGWAVRIQASCSDNSVLNNNFMSNTFDVSTNGSLVLNTFLNNFWDKYEGYDINKDGIGDVPYHPVSMYSMIVEENPNSLILLKSFLVSLLDKAEKAIPSLTPENLYDAKPMMKANPL